MIVIKIVFHFFYFIIIRSYIEFFDSDAFYSNEQCEAKRL